MIEVDKQQFIFRGTPLWETRKAKNKLKSGRGWPNLKNKSMC